MSSTRVQCDVVIPEGVQIGEYANAFRVLPEVNSDCILDFLHYSANAGQARVVSRVRVRRDFIEAVQSRLREFLVEFPDVPAVQVPSPVLTGDVDTPLVVTGGVVTMPNGDVVVFGVPGKDSDEEN